MTTPPELYKSYLAFINSRCPIERWEGYKILSTLLIQAKQKENGKGPDISKKYHTLNRIMCAYHEIDRKNESIMITPGAVREGYKFKGVWPIPTLMKNIRLYFEKYGVFPSLREFKAKLLQEFEDQEFPLKRREQIEHFIIDALPEVTGSIS